MTTETKQQMVEVVVAHFKENMDWTKNLKYKTHLISTSGTDMKSNKGFEASVYLKYIIDNYDSLPDYTIFLHGHRNSWHCKQNMDAKISSLEFKYPYCNINEPKLTLLSDYKGSYDQMVLMMPEVEKILGISIPLDKLKYKCAAQFYVSKNSILRNKKDIYIALYNYLIETKFESFWTGRLFEYIWHILFTGNIVDIDYF
ncbi:MAG: DUF3431 domain-containing protein [Bacteroidetes bacterium]|nr:DUF3431 domain-containing protein [Bacteroidota bacterium]